MPPNLQPQTHSCSTVFLGQEGGSPYLGLGRRPLRALVTICLWGISVGLRLACAWFAVFRDLGTREVPTHSLGLVDGSDWSAAQSPPCSQAPYPGRSPEGAKTPSPGGSTVVSFCQTITYEDVMSSWPVKRGVRQSAGSSLPPRE